MTLTDILPAEAIVAGSAAPAFPGGRTTVEAVARPGTTGEAASVLAWAAREGVAVVPVGTGRHLPRFVPPERCVVLSTDRMSGIELYEPADLTFTAGAGTPLRTLAEELGRHRQWLPFDPPDVGARSLGGLVASGLSGPLAAGYGEFRNHVLGVTAVFGDGRVVRLGGRVVKNVAGFDLLRPVVGSHGSLAILTSVCMRVFPLPETDRLLVLRAREVDALVRATRSIATAPVLPASTLLAVGGDGPAGESCLVVRLQGATPTVDADQQALEHRLGVAFEVVEGEEAARLHEDLRDRPSRVDGVGVVAILPDRLEAVLAAVMRAVGGAGVPELVAEPFGAGVRFAFGAGDVPALEELRRHVEEEGGTLGVERLPVRVEGGAAAPDPIGLAAAVDRAVSVPTAGEVALAERVRAVFDPAGILRRGSPAPTEAGVPA